MNYAINEVMPRKSEIKESRWSRKVGRSEEFMKGVRKEDGVVASMNFPLAKLMCSSTELVEVVGLCNKLPYG
jgi:hypothetical protein